jgi:arginine/lysine/histidine transport system permease protein
MDFSFLGKYYPLFIEGIKHTLLLAVFTVLFGVVLGIFIALMRISKHKGLRYISSAYVEFIRGTPILVQLLLIYYGLPKIGIDFSDIPVIGPTYGDFLAGIITLSINSSAYIAEIIRAGIQAVDKGQMEAARSLGLNEGISMRFVILPQAIKNILPALGNEFVVIIKESSIVSVIGIQELMYKADTVRGITFQPFEPLMVAAILYFIITFTLSKFLGMTERRLNTNVTN